MGVPNPEIELIDKKGKRTDGRRPDEVRPLHIEAGVLHRADGSCYLEWGNNKVMAAVHGPREYQPRRFQKADRAVVRCKYNMAAFSTSDRKRPGPDRRSQEIGKVISDAFHNVVLVENYPRGVIDIDMEILQADAGTRCAALTAAAVALADAGIPMKGLVSAVAAGKVNGTICVDLNGPEDNFGEADLPIAINHTTGEIVLLQMDGHLSPDEFDQALDMCVAACGEVVKAQRAALQKRFDDQMAEMEASGASIGGPSAVEEQEEPREEDRGGRGGRGGERSGDRSGGRGGGRSGGRGGGRSGGRGGRSKKEAN